MKELLDLSRRKLGAPPRNFNFVRKMLNKLPKKEWVANAGTGLEKVYQDQNLLLEQGKVVWGAVVIANEMLWSGEGDATAAIVYSLDPHFEENLGDLIKIAQSLHDLADSNKPDIDPQLKPIIDSISAQNMPLFNAKLPENITNGRKVYYTVLPVFLKQLPYPALQQGWFAMLAHPEKTDMAMVLPYKYWDADLQNYWFRGKSPLGEETEH